ncbi:MAG: putative ATP-dependent RecD-like DNA helicase [Promethearchaeota archaeon]|nr:MAG: putative ATP-dependent RecD-like DNA helicase [Candidatus Lokiarchaeota archaeon]
MAKFSKTLLQSYILTNCTRRLFLELGREMPQLWFNPVRPIPEIAPERLIFQTKYLKEKGKQYEQIVYSHLKTLENTYFREVEGEVQDTVLVPDHLLKFNEKHKDNKASKLILLLEYEFVIPKSFFYQVFPAKKQFKDIPVEYSSQRPDLIFIGNKINEYVDEVYELGADGIIKRLSKAQENERIAISIFDIKYTNEENIGKKHFLEIFYYLKTIAYYLKYYGLDDKYYVRANYNGILPLRDEGLLLNLQTIEDLFTQEILSLVSWKEADRIYNRVITAVQQLWKLAPCPISQIKTNIHDGCGYCQFIEDCKESLGMKEKDNPESWSIELIPFTSKSIAQQLIKEFNFKTIGDLSNNFDKIQVGSTPKPLYSELPTLKLKTRALKNNRLIYPKNKQTYSYSIPRYSPLSIYFDVEYDRNTDRIFAVGILLKMYISSRLKYHGIFYNWWRIWKRALEEEKPTIDIQQELNDYLVREINIENVDVFLNCLKKLKNVKITLKGENNSKSTRVMYRFAKVNKDITKESEADLTINTIMRLNLILQMCNIIEDYIVVDEIGQYGKYHIGPDTSIFYWSRNQLDHLQDMIQRNLDIVIGKAKARAAYEAILMYFTPSDTEVSNPYQYKKLFDVQNFAESCIGFPDIINYTWHGIAKKLFNEININTKMYWIPHFNFLDLSTWLLYLREKDPLKKQKKMAIIKGQIILKLHIIDRIRSKFQIEGHKALSKNARTVSRHHYKSAILPSEFHDISHVWYLFSLLNSAIQQQDDEYYRTMFPDFSIGKLESARVTTLKIIDLPGKSLRYTFLLTGLSSNMKLREGDRVLLIPNVKRGLKIDKWVYRWVIYIDEIQWDSSIKGNAVSSKPTRTNVFEICKEENINPATEEWYLYKISSDAWSKKLYNTNNNGLLQREEFGTSWLGARLAYLWNIRSKPKLKWPRFWAFTIPSIYLFAPSLLDHFKEELRDKELRTNITPAPDASQKEAIINALSNNISAILGPPGTGKSQTIAALIDEYVIRRRDQGKSARILITSFSYAALRVVIDKIRKSKDSSGTQTPSSHLQMVFIHSSRQAPISQIPNCRDVDDLVKEGSTWKLNGKTRTVTQTILLEESLEDDFIIFANAHQLYHLINRVSEDFYFDLICVDEASQLPADYFMSSLQFVKRPPITIKKPEEMIPKHLIGDKAPVETLTLLNTDISPDMLTKIIVVGDHNQLPPVRVKKPPKNLELVLDNIFRYYMEGHNISRKQLKINYRSHQDIVEFTSILGIYEDLHAHEHNATRLLEGDMSNIPEEWVRKVLKPERVAGALIHDEQFEIGISLFEAQMVAKIVEGFYSMTNPSTPEEELHFWSEQIGVVSPHNAQGRAIIRNIFNLFSLKTKLQPSRLMQSLKETVYSVEKFQGSDRDLIICSIGLSDEDKLHMEDEFIYNMNRFNVLTSRAKNKFIFVCSEKFIQFIPEEREILKMSSKVFLFVEEFCNTEESLKIKNNTNNIIQEVRLRYKK